MTRWPTLSRVNYDANKNEKKNIKNEWTTSQEESSVDFCQISINTLFLNWRRNKEMRLVACVKKTHGSLSCDDLHKSFVAFQQRAASNATNAIMKIAESTRPARRVLYFRQFSASLPCQWGILAVTWIIRWQQSEAIAWNHDQKTWR